MRIENLRLENSGDRARAAATVIWENCGRPAMEVFFETPARFAGDFSCNPHAFLIPCAIAALRFGEERVSVEADVCPELRGGLITAMSWMRHWYSWYGPGHKLPRIEAGVQSSPPGPGPEGRAAMLFSGGIDSLAALRANRLGYPPEHPGYFKDALLAFGLEVHKPESFEHVLRAMSPLTEQAGLTLIPVYTNVIELGPREYEDWFTFFTREFMGASLACIAHVFAGRLSAVTISSCYDIPNLFPYGSHPLINPNYGSSDLLVHHEGIAMSRFEKTKLISGWPLAMENLRVCNRTGEYEAGRFNCGKCEKCIRTMLGLLAAGALGNINAFPLKDVKAEMVDAIYIQPSNASYFAELIAPLKAVGRDDLAGAVRRAIRRGGVRYRWMKARNRTVHRIKEMDRTYLNEGLLRLKRSMFNRGASTG